MISCLSEKGPNLGSIGEFTAVASANRGVLGGLAKDEDVDEESVEEMEPADLVRIGARFKAVGRFFSSRPIVDDNDSKVASPFFLFCCLVLCVGGDNTYKDGRQVEEKEDTSLQ